MDFAFEFTEINEMTWHSYADFSSDDPASFFY